LSFALRWKNRRNDLAIKHNTDLRIEEVRSFLDYDLITGLFRWKEQMGGYAQKGTIAGSVDKSRYRRIRINKTVYAAHRLAWLYVTGKWPKNDIDHKNLIRDDNRFYNLREATRAQNIANTKVRSDNKTRLRGVTQCRYPDPGFISRLTINGERIYLGYFKSAAEAHAAYLIAAQKFYGEYHRV
jgi:hypothetical protein